MKKPLFAAFFFLLSLSGVPSSLPAKTLEICPSCPLSSIRKGIEEAEAGDTLLIKQGTYAEGMLLIQKPLHLIGVGSPRIDGGNREHVFYVRGDDVHFEGLVIQNSGMSSISEYAGLRIEGGRNCRIQNNIFENNTYSIYLAKVESCRIENNRITGNAKGEVMGGNGVHLWYSKNITIEGNEIARHRDGIYIEFSGDSTIEGNLSRGNLRYGLHFMYSPRNRYLKNVFSENQTGVAVMYSRNVEMKENRFEKSWGPSSYGLLLKDISDSRIEGNTIEANTVGLFADEINRDEFIRNTFRRNGWAVNILGSSEDNRFAENDFISNYFNVATNSRESFNTFEGNYWSDYRGYDLNRDGRGDVPFRPMKIFSLWVSRYPELVVLLQSPVIEFIEVAERIFPVLTPKTLQDGRPRMKRMGAS